MYTIDELHNRLPNVGDRVLRKPILYGMDPKNVKKRWGTVIFVHPINLWYLVEFNINGHKVKQGYNILNNISERNQQHNKIDNDFNLVYDGVSSVPKKIPRMDRDPNNHDKLSDVVWELEKYNQKHHTCIKYGDWVYIIDKQKKRKSAKHHESSPATINQI